LSVIIKEPNQDKKEELSKLLQNFSKDHNYIKDNYGTLLKKYEDQYIAVRNKKVVYHADNLEKLVEKIKLNDDEVNKYVIDYLTSKDVCYLY